MKYLNNYNTHLIIIYPIIINKINKYILHI